jgi:hypothetical protein
VLLDQRRSRLNRDGVVPVVEARDEVEEVEDESVIDGTQLGRGNTELWCGLGPGNGWITGAVRGILNKLSCQYWAYLECEEDSLCVGIQLECQKHSVYCQQDEGETSGHHE